MHSTMKRELSHEIAFRKSIPQYKDVHWLHHRYYKNEHKNVQYHQQTLPEQWQTRFALYELISATEQLKGEFHKSEVLLIASTLRVVNTKDEMLYG